MAVSDDYLSKIRRAIRRTSSELDIELVDVIEECRLDLISLGVSKEKAEDESDSLILGAVRSFARWKFGVDDASREDYMLMRDELRKRVDYVV
jgi:hypothetical protein